MRSIAIFGGTFDPVHWGHLILAETALYQVPLEYVIWVPSLNPPHKQATSFEHRVEMLQLGIKDNPSFAISLVEVNRSGTSYAIDTLLELSTFYPNTHWYWILGLDAILTLPRWYRGRELVQMCDFLVAPRLVGGENIAQTELICKQVEQQLQKQFSTIKWQLLHIPIVGLSSSLIRQMCSERQSIRYLVPESVRYYIAAQNLYFHKSK
ncbi:nicotinate (nicotinamide) nucleotide adenylyltransferase [Plectonema radiosum NIES-515]|uniref:Probable nicotinate-nucleotide adenylyltransferase n=1 Tax=Plectonema radiosum NIES-515 TaxID=2986073 RepID=A0ABT3ASJ5_9CYAN|nr:nicotinate (nicotinamide) nucleotide adenylyltransferase [Plectonema radiosum]MCV3212092.1 nicotinate (nicotinamide) nucleotide adenylyltransferase [Plectonema radiosum NIES-515]